MLAVLVLPPLTLAFLLGFHYWSAIITVPFVLRGFSETNAAIVELLDVVSIDAKA